MSNEYIGRSIYLGIAKETTRGTAPASPDFWLRLLAQNHKQQVDYLHSQGSQGTIVENAHAEVDKQWAEGGFDAEIEPDSIGLVLLSLMGGVVSAPEGTGHLHTYDLDDNSANHQSLAVYTAEPARDETFPLACMDSLTFNFERGKILDFSANYISQAGSAGSHTPAFTDLKVFRPKDFHFYIADDIAGLATADEVFLKSFNLEFNKNLEHDDVLGLESPQNFLNKVFSTSATMELFHKDETYRNLFKAGTPKAIRVKIENPNLEIDEATKAQGTATVVDYAELSGKKLTVGGVELTEGVDWTAATSNDATATSLASAVDALPNVTASATTNEVNIVAATGGTAGNSITLVSDGGSDLTVSGATLTGGLDDGTYANMVFDFARVYFSEHDENNGRDDIKAQTITLSFAVNTDEATIPFGQVRLLNETASY